jgi:hypothetical protein
MISKEAAMVGSEKQIAWATDIRTAAQAGLNELEAQFAGAPNAAARNLAERALAAVRAEESAAWWIEHRSDTPKELMVAQIRAKGLR